MTSPTSVVVGPTGTAAERIAAGVEECTDLTAETLPMAEIRDLVAADPPACIVCTADAGTWPRLELLAGSRDRAPGVPFVLVTDGDAHTPERAAAATADGTAIVRADGDVPVEEIASRVADLVDGTIDPPADEASASDDRAEPARSDAPARTGPGDERSAGGDPAELSALLAERDRFATLVDELPDPVLVSALGGEPEVQYVNPAFEETFGIVADEAVGRPVSEVVTPAEDCEYVDFEQVSRSETVERTVRRRTVDGVRTFLFRGVRTEVGDGTEGLVVYTDITDRQRRAQQVNALHGTTRELFAADDRGAIGEAVVDAAREIIGLPATGVHLLDEAGRLSPVAYSETAGDLFDGTPPSYSQADDVAWSIFESGEPLIARDVSSVDVDPSPPLESVIAFPLGDHGILISSSTERQEFSEEAVDLVRLLAANTEAALDRLEKEAALRDRERELRAERDRLSALFENVPIPAVKADHRDGEPIVLDVNPAFEEEFGFDGDRLIGDNLDDYVMPDDEVPAQKSVKDRASAGQTVTREVRRRTADGLRDFLLTIAPVEPGVTDGLAFGFYIDITDRKQRQQRLRVLSRVLRHDIRNRMNVAEGYAELVADRSDDPSISEPAVHIRREATDLLQLSRKTRLVEQTVAAAAENQSADLLVLARDVVAAVRDRNPACTVTTEFAVDGPLWTTDTVAVAVQELVENAIEHNDADHPDVAVRVTADEEYHRVAVADDGPGIPPGERELIEEEREPTPLAHGSGIGLWLVKWIVGAQGGDVTFEDREPRGTVVQLRLPRRDQPSIEGDGSTARDGGRSIDRNDGRSTDG